MREAADFIRVTDLCAAWDRDSLKHGLDCRRLSTWGEEQYLPQLPPLTLSEHVLSWFSSPRSQAHDCAFRTAAQESHSVTNQCSDTHTSMFSDSDSLFVTYRIDIYVLHLANMAPQNMFENMTPQ
eukprot:2857489-Amphidinium_carterae.1